LDGFTTIRGGVSLPSGSANSLLGYRFLATKAPISELPVAPPSLSSRLDINAFDFDYASANLFSAITTHEWRVGGRWRFSTSIQQAYQAFTLPGAPEYVLGSEPPILCGLGPHAVWI